MMKPISYGRQEITDEDIQAVITTLRSDYLTQGPAIAAFEQAFAGYVQAKYAVAVNNGTAALHLSTLAIGVQPGDKVIVTSLTFAASANCVRYCGGEVVFCDIDPDTYLMDLNKLRQLLEAHPKGTFKGIIPVDFAGYPIEGNAFKALADEYDLWIIEDACHAPGAFFIDENGQRQKTGNGKYADLTVFSFHPVKHITTGEGGMVTTDDPALYERLLTYRTHGITKDPQKMSRHDGGWYMEMQELGYNYRLTDFQAALGLSQLKRADKGIERRRQLVRQYNEAFRACPQIKTPVEKEGAFHAYHLYVIQVDDRLGLYNYLCEKQIFTQVHYIPLHTMPYYLERGNKRGDHPIVEAYYEHCLSLPMYPTLTDAEQTYVINEIIGYLSR